MRGVFYWARFGVWGPTSPVVRPEEDSWCRGPREGGADVARPDSPIFPDFARISRHCRDISTLLLQLIIPEGILGIRGKKGMAQCNKLRKLIKSTITVLPPIWMEIRTGNIPHSPLFWISWIVFRIFLFSSVFTFLFYGKSLIHQCDVTAVECKYSSGCGFYRRYPATR